MNNTKTILAALLLSVSMFLPQQAKAQAPEKMSYQTIVRDASNNLVASTAVGMKISILQGSASGTLAFTETHSPTTNANGLASVEIGSIDGATFAAMSWANGPYFVKTEIDPAGGTTYTITGTSQLLSVPYALHAKTAGTNYTQAQRDALTAYAGLVVYNSTTNKPNYYNVTEWMNYDGTSAKTLAIGDSYQGGIIFYLDACGCHGLISAPSDQSSGIRWYNGSYTPTGATGAALGTGQANTTTIVSIQGAGSYAAQLCNDLELGGYSDWYLPSKDELNKLYVNRVAIGGFANLYYWSSTENDNYNAWNQDFNYGLQDASTKTNLDYVRAVRAF